MKDNICPNIDDVFCEVEDAVDDCGWNFGRDWDGNTLMCTISD